MLPSAILLALYLTSARAYVNPCDGSYMEVAIGDQYEVSFWQPGPCGGATIVFEDNTSNNLSPDYTGCGTPNGTTQLFNITLGTSAPVGNANLTFVCESGVRCYSLVISPPQGPAALDTTIDGCANNDTQAAAASLTSSPVAGQATQSASVGQTTQSTAGWVTSTTVAAATTAGAQSQIYTVPSSSSLPGPFATSCTCTC